MSKEPKAVKRMNLVFSEQESDAFALLSTVGRKKTLIITLALREFAEKYHLKGSDNKTLSVFLESYPFLKNLQIGDVASIIKTQEVQETVLPLPSPVSIPVEVQNITQEKELKEENKKIEIKKNEVFETDEDDMDNLNNAKSMLALFGG